ncbi:hypothetical protein, partial [Bacillus subtilis]|uniref:hypothetical protein n=1 Tax=Bacillus subtilis TaxID=1423 RepID=UPI0011A89CC2
MKLPHLFSSYLHLHQPPSTLHLPHLPSYTLSPPHQKHLQHLLLHHPIYKHHLLPKPLTILHFLHHYPPSQIPFQPFLPLFPSLKPRYYSISTSPKLHPNILS